MSRPLVAALLYPGCIVAEIEPALTLLSGFCEVLIVSPDGADHQALTRPVEADYAALLTLPVAAVLVPGGDPGAIIPLGLASAGLQAAARQGAVMAGICAGSLVLASAGLLVGRRGTHNFTDEYATPEQVAFTRPFWQGLHFERADVVVDGRIVTAQPWAADAFAAALARCLGCGVAG
jgi:putative intracellular protease/amidase